MTPNSERTFEQLLSDLSDDDLDRQEAAYEREIGRLNVLVTAVRATRDARRILRGEHAAGNSGRLNMADALLAVMHHDAKRQWTVDDLLLRLGQVGFVLQGKTPRNSVAATLSRLVDDRLVLRAKRGVYALPIAAPLRSTPDEVGWSSPQGDDGD